MKGIYSKYATGTLKELMDAASECDDRANLAGEVDAARALCMEAIKVCSVVMDPPIDKDTGKPKVLPPELRFNAVQVAQTSLEHVSKVVERMVKVMAMSDATFNSNQVDGICTAIINILTNRLEGQDDILKQIVSDIEGMKAIKKTDVQIHIT